MNVFCRVGLSGAMLLVLSACATGPDMKIMAVYEEQLRLNPPSTVWIEGEIERLTTDPTPTNEAVTTLLNAELNARGYQAAQAEWKREQIERRYRLDPGNSGRGGAIHRQPAYIHTLAPRQTLNSTVAFATVTEAFAVPGTDVRAGAGYSHYELSRWQRYCNEGKGMDKADWRFIRKEGTHNVPRDIFPNCKPPKHLS